MSRMLTWHADQLRQRHWQWTVEAAMIHMGPALDDDDDC